MLLRDSELWRLVNYLEVCIEKHIISDDIWRIKNSFYGHLLLPQHSQHCMVLVGLRSGLELLHALTQYNDIKIIVIDHNLYLRRKIISALSEAPRINFSERVKFYSSFHDLKLDREVKRVASFVRIDVAYFDTSDILNFLQIWRIDHLCGEFDPVEIDPLRLYRCCRDAVETFYLRIKGSVHPLTGKGDQSNVEVSVVVPAYKSLSCIDRCLESLVFQSMKKIEIIVVDDGSPDETGHKADEWKCRYPTRVRVVHKENKGCASARNVGIREAKGEYVGFVDADDWVEHEMFEELYRAAILHSAEISQCGYQEFFEDTERSELYPTAWKGDGPHGLSGIVTDTHSYLSVKPTIWRRIYKREFLFGNGIEFPEHIRRFDDLPFQFETFSRAKRIAVIPNCYYYYRQGREGQDVAVKDRRLYVHFAIFDWLYEKVISWADYEIEYYLTKCEINTHLWAISRIERKLRMNYFRRASRQFVKSKMNFGPLTLLRIGYKMGVKAFFFVLKCLLLYKLPEPRLVVSD